MTVNFANGFVCRDCMRSLRGSRTKRIEVFSHRKQSTGVIRRGRRPLRVGIIGSGPAGFYAAARIIQKSEDAFVDMYEQLPAPFGLVRYGVAPDHPEVKNCQDRFDEVAQSPRFTFIGNVAIGERVPLRSLKAHYDALLFSYGASKDRKLGVPGEDLPGIVSARAFVGWYNGLPEYENLDPDLTVDDTAHVIGNGNVALDVARVLLSDVNRLRTTDISAQALDILSRSRIKHVHIYGRRGPMQAAFTIKEIRELMTLPRVAFEPMDPQFLPQADYISKLPRLEQRKYRLAALLAKGTQHGAEQLEKSWSLRSLLSPAEFKPIPGSAHLESMILDKTGYDEYGDTFRPTARVHKTGQQIERSARLVFRSIGYKSQTLNRLQEDLGIVFDEKAGIIPNDIHGRVMNPAGGPTSLTAQHVYGCYCAGWVKNGPTGVIASTMDDAFASADILLKDWEGEVPFLNGTRAATTEGTGQGWAGVIQETEVKIRGIPRNVSWQDWLIIDADEKKRGKRSGKPREKIKGIDEMLSVLD